MTEHLRNLPLIEPPKPGPVLVCLQDVVPCEIAWLWPGRLPLRRISLLVGRPGEGKSFLTADLASRVSTGSPWPDGSECPLGSVLLLSAEDDAGDTIRPRLDAHHANVRRIHLLSAVRMVDDAGERERIVTLADVQAIEDALRRLPNCRLIVVDPIGSYLGSGADANRDNEVRSVLSPIAALAEKYGPAVLVVAHRRKSAAISADDTALGSRAFTGIARCVWHLSRDGENKQRRLLLPGKNNLAREGTGLAFTIGGEPARISWERDPVAMTADDGLAAENAGPRKPGPGADARDEAADWLTAALADGPREVKELFDEWKNGQGGSKTTLERAKKSLGIESFRNTVPGPWWWQLSKDANLPEGKEPGDLGHLANNRGNIPAFKGEESKGSKFSHPGNLADGNGDGWPEGFLPWEGEP